MINYDHEDEDDVDDEDNDNDPPDGAVDEAKMLEKQKFSICVHSVQSFVSDKDDHDDHFIMGMVMIMVMIMVMVMMMVIAIQIILVMMMVVMMMSPPSILSEAVSDVKDVILCHRSCRARPEKNI